MALPGVPSSLAISSHRDFSTRSLLLSSPACFWEDLATLGSEQRGMICQGFNGIVLAAAILGRLGTRIKIGPLIRDPLQLSRQEAGEARAGPDSGSEVLKQGLPMGQIWAMIKREKERTASKCFARATGRKEPLFPATGKAGGRCIYWVKNRSLVDGNAH